MDTLLSKTTTELRKARGDVEATKAILLRYYQEGIQGKLLQSKSDGSIVVPEPR